VSKWPRYSVFSKVLSPLCCFLEETLSPINTKSSLGSWPPTPTLKKLKKIEKKREKMDFLMKKSGFISFFLFLFLKKKR
jgi:hypothetical protein